MYINVATSQKRIGAVGIFRWYNGGIPLPVNSMATQMDPTVPLLNLILEDPFT